MAAFMTLIRSRLPDGAVSISPPDATENTSSSDSLVDEKVGLSLEVRGENEVVRRKVRARVQQLRERRLAKRAKRLSAAQPL